VLRILFALVCAGGVASANPLSLARFGGLRGDATYRGAYALYWNPAALADEPGWDLGVDAQLIARQASYDRDAALNHVPDSEVAANAGRATISTVGVAPSVMARWGRRLGAFDVGLGAGAFVESGGSANWDKNFRAPPGAPGALDGPQRWSSISAQLLVVELGLGAGVRHRASGLSLGFTPILAIAQFSTVRARNLDQSEDLVDAAGNPKEGRAFFAGSGVAFSAILGARWDLGRGFVLGASWQHGARFSLDGDLRVVFGAQAPSSQHARLGLPIADQLRVSAALPATRWLTMRPTFEMAFWSILREHVFASAADGTVLLQIPRDSGDMLAGRLRADARVSGRWQLMFEVGLEKGPTPARTLEPGFGEGSSVQAGVGARVGLTHYVDLSASFLFHYFFPVTVGNSAQRPTANGTYADQRQYLIVDLEVHAWRPSPR
jgi:hypothetical protein